MKSIRPYVSINMAMSLDGRITTGRREPAVFTSRRDKKLLVALRARADAVMAGGGTVAADTMSMGIVDPRLRKARVKRGLAPHPLRVVISGTLSSLSARLKVFRKKISPVVIFCSEAAPLSRRRRFSKLARVIVCGRHEVDLKRACRVLARDFGVRHLHVEGGGGLNGALLDAGIVDELDLTLAGVLFGGREAPTAFEGRGVARIGAAPGLRLASLERRGDEVFLRYLRKGRKP